MLRFVWRKMLNNKSLVLCLLIGMVLAVGMVVSVPLFTGGILNRMLQQDLKEYQERTNVYPGRYYYEVELDAAYKSESRLNALGYFNRTIPELIDQIGVPVNAYSRIYTIDTFRAAREDALPDKHGKVDRTRLRVAAMNEPEGKLSYLYGREPSGTLRQDGAIEVAVSYTNMVANDWRMDVIYEVVDTAKRFADEEPLRFVIVGVFELANPADPYWFDSGLQVQYYAFMNPQLFDELFILPDMTYISNISYYMPIDIDQLRISNLTQVEQNLTAQSELLKSKRAGKMINVLLKLTAGYSEREQELRTMLTVLQIPILLMLAFYVYMTAQLIVKQEQGEIAVLKSRGASRGQIVGIYAIESAILGAFAGISGLGLGYLICKVLGASNGFLEFVNRKALRLEMNGTVLVYALVTVLFAAVTMVMPALRYSRASIVEHKTEKNRRKAPFWQKCFLDLILLAISCYGLYAYHTRMFTMEISGMDANAMPIDPLLFVMSTLFIVGAGLLFVRVFPYLVRLVFFIGKKRWSPVFYASFLQVGRSSGQEAFLMLFLVMTLSVGLFSANAARTINTNTVQRVQYNTGADIVVTPYWQSNAYTVQDENGAVSVVSKETSSGYSNDGYVTYVEPPYALYSQIQGVEASAKVLLKRSVTGNFANKNSAVTVMAIEPSCFGKTAYMPDHLLPYHWYYYLNMLASDQKGCLITRAYADAYGISVGDTVKTTWNKQNAISLRVYAIVDYWPGYNPYEEGRGANHWIICNLSYAQDQMMLEPYQVWLKMTPDATTAQVYQSITDLRIGVTSLSNSRQDVIAVKNDPLIQGVNGALTMGFIVTMIVCAIGFILYWVLSIRARVLQFGILRAMGLSKGKVLGMLGVEQALISGSAILSGLFTGALTSKLFVPLFQIVYSAQELVPPFHVVMQRADYYKVYIILALMLAVGLTILGVMISRIKIAQALKLGED